MSSKNQKHIKSVLKDHRNKIAAPEDEYRSISTNDRHPAFCFKHIQKGFSIDDCSDDKIKAIFVTKLQHLSQTSWREIQQTARKGAGHEIISIDSLKMPTPKNTPEDRDFLSFRLGGGRNSVFLGYRDGKIFYIVWIDPNGKIYSH